ncbi:MAG: septation protein A, partial [Gammaproteobacteria bacterium]|nr:septation protein A [Gammaproteobacteria bacterium]
MKLLYDFFPIALFFAAYQIAGIYAATVVAILASLAQVGHFWFKNRRFETMHLVSLSLIVVLGGLTLILRDKAFIMWKPTLVNWLFAAAFLATSLIGKRPLIHRILGSQLDLPKNVWQRLNSLWIGFFLLSGAANIFFVQNYQSAEAALIQASPQLEASQITDLDCEVDFSGDSKPLCLDA